MNRTGQHALAALLALGGLGLMLALLAVLPDRSSIDQRLQRGFPLRVGYALEAPYAYMGADGELRGESVDVLRHVLHDLGMDSAQHVRLDFGSLLEELEAGRIDLIAGGLFITPERAARVRFTRPTAAVGPALLLRDPLPVAGEPIRLAVIEGSVEAADPGQFVAGAYSVLRLPDARTAMAALSLGEADALALSAPSLRWMAQHWSSAAALRLQLVDTPQRGYPAYAVARAEEAFAMRLDAALADYLGSPEHLRAAAAYGFLESDVRPVLGAGSRP